MSRFQLLVGKHVQEEIRTKVVDGQPVTRVVTCEYAAYDPKRNIVDAGKAVVATRNASGQVLEYKPRIVDLCEVCNQPGFSEKFRKLQEPEQLAQDMPNEDLLRFARVAIEKGLITEADMHKAATANDGGQFKPTTTDPVSASKPAEPQQDPLRVAQLKRDLANVAKMPLIGLCKLAEDEELDINHCKNAEGEWQESLVRTAVRTAIEARIK